MMQGRKTMSKENFILKSDSYKFGHGPMYSNNTTTVYSYFEARKGAKFDTTVFFTLQYILKRYFVNKIITKEMIDNAEKIINIHLGPEVFNRTGWQYILDTYEGRLPLSIKAVPEGTVVPVGNVLFTVENTDPKCFWLTNFVESILSHVWYGSSTATLTFETKLMLRRFLDITDEDPEATINFSFHDFGYRSSSSDESAAIGGAGQLLSFMGTDTVTAIEFLMKYYKAEVCAYSVNASEHSVMSGEGREGEFNVVQRLLNNYPKGILSLVIDSYDYRNFIKEAGTTFKDQIMSRDGKLVFRPDSGEPVATSLEVINLIGYYFGYTINSKGYKILNPKVGMLWGDGINLEGIYSILQNLVDNGWATSNIVFGQGGALHHSGVSRDMQRCAFKSSYQVADGIGKNIFKDPIDGSKKSKKGRLALVYRDDKYGTLEEVEGVVEDDLLVEVFRNGELLIEYSLDEVKANLAKY
jgi:nicotinamide phosphoribosyltransferase